MRRIKKIAASAITIAWLFSPALLSKSANRPVDYEYLDNNKKYVERVDYDTFRSNLDSRVSKQKLEGQDFLIEEIIKTINNHPLLTKERGYNMDKRVNEDEFAKFIFDDVLKEKLNYEIKTPTDLLVGLNMALEYMAKYNMKMVLENPGLGSDINEDGRFDGVSWSALQKIESPLKEEIIKTPKKGVEVCKKECERVDGSATDLLLMGTEEDLSSSIFSYTYETKKISKNKGEPNSVGLICRNYMSALQIMFETAKKKYPGLTENVELLQLQMPGHIFGAFVNKKTLEYIVVDPTWHDSGNGFNMEIFAWPKEEVYHEDCLKKEASLQAISLEKDLHEYWSKYEKEIFFHSGSKKMLDNVMSKVQELAKKYPKSSDITELEMMTYLNLTNYKEYSKAFELLKNIYDNKGMREKMESYKQCLMLLYLGGIAFELKDYKQAVVYYKECSRFRVANNNFVDEAILGIAESNLELKNYYEALFRAKDVLEICPEHYEKLRKDAKSIALKASKKLWDSKKRKTLKDYIEGNYEGTIKNLTGQDSETRLLLAESYSALNRYEQAKPIYETLMKESSNDIASLAESELKQMNRKFFLYGYTNFFDNKVGKSIEQFEFLKKQITPKDETAEKLSYLLMYAYATEKNKDKAVNEGEYFIKTFPNSEYKESVKEFLKNIDEIMKQG